MNLQTTAQTVAKHRAGSVAGGGERATDDVAKRYRFPFPECEPVKDHRITKAEYDAQHPAVQSRIPFFKD